MTALETAVRTIVDLLVRGEYGTVERISRGRRLSAAELERAVTEYGRRLCAPESEWWDSVELTPITAAAEPAFHVAAPLWTVEEGRSDLTLELRLIEIAEEVYDTEVEDLHVL